MDKFLNISHKLLRNAVIKMSTNKVPDGKPKPHKAHMGLWRKITYFIVFPALAGLFGTIGPQILAHEPERPEFIPYEHLRIRTKKYPWGDGQRTFFHNPHVNPLKDGYEEDVHAQQASCGEGKMQKKIQKVSYEHNNNELDAKSENDECKEFN